MNEHNANRIAVFDPTTQTMVEYTVPSRNTSWADCEGIEYCGVSQVFGFTIDDKKIWFTEWAEHNIGVVDTSVSLPFDIDLNRENIVLKRGETTDIILEFSSADIAPHGHLVNISTTSLFDLKNLTFVPSSNCLMPILSLLLVIGFISMTFEI